MIAHTNVRSKPWLDDQAKNAADKRISATLPMIGYPNFLLDPLFLFNQTAALKLGSSHIQNTLELARADVVHSWLPFPAAMKDADASMSPLTVNAEYIP